MAGNFLANAGLVAQGMDEANAAQQRLQTGQIGLDELQRSTDQAKQYRAAVSGSDPSAGRMGAYHSISKAAIGAGDIDTYNKAQEASKKLQDEGFGQLAMGALTGKPPAEIESQFNGLGIMKIQPGSLEWGKDPASGDIVARGVSQADSKPYVFNATQYAKLHGLIKGAEFDIKDGVIFNKNTGETKTADTRGDWVLGSIANGNTEVPLIYNKRDGSIQQLGPGGVRTNIDAKIHTTPDGKVIVTQAGGGVAEFKPSADAVPGKSSLFGTDTPGTPAQAARVVPAQVDSPPVAGAQKAPDGNWYVKTANGYARVNVAGQAAPTAAPAAVAAPAAASKPAAAPATAPVSTPSTPTQTAEPANPVDARAAYISKQIDDLAQQQGVAYSEYEKSGFRSNDAKEKLDKISAELKRLRAGRREEENAQYIASEKERALKAGRSLFNRGGKVGTRQQKHGLE